MESINNRVKKLRNELGLSQEAFGKAIGLSKSGVSNIENGRRKVSNRHIKLICTAFNIKEGWLLFGINEDQLSKDIKIIETFEAYLVSIGYLLSNEQVSTESYTITIRKAGVETVFTEEEFEAFQAEIEQSVEYQLWKKNQNR